MTSHTEPKGDTMTKTDRARSILDERSNNEWDGSSGLEELAGSRYAVCIERDDDSWVNAANTLEEVGKIIAGTFHTESYVEWVDDVIDLETGESVGFDTETVVTVRIAGERVEVRA